MHTHGPGGRPNGQRGATRIALDRVWIGEATHHELLPPDDRRRHHRKGRAHRAHAAGEHERGVQRVSGADDAEICIEVIVLNGPVGCDRYPEIERLRMERSRVAERTGGTVKCMRHRADEVTKCTENEHLHSTRRSSSGSTAPLMS